MIKARLSRAVPDDTTDEFLWFSVYPELNRTPDETNISLEENQV
jgi:hypothetical protein